MPKLPDKYDLGQAGSLQTGRGVIKGSDYGAGIVGAAVEKAAGVGLGVLDEETKKMDALDVIKAEAYRRPKIMELENSFDRDPDHATFDQRFQPAAKQIDEEAASLIRNKEARELFGYKAGMESTLSRNRVLDKGTKLAKQNAYVDTDESLRSMSAAFAYPGASDEQKDAVLYEMKGAIGLAKNSGLVDPLHAQHLEKAHIYGNGGIIYREAENRLWDDPYSVLNDLHAAGKRAPAAPTGAEPALALIRAEEGFAPAAKRDFKQLSNGYGTKASRPGETISREEAERRMAVEAGKVSTFLDDNVTVPLSPKQRAALTSFGYNLGTGQGGLSDLVPDINAGKFDRVAERMLSYNQAGGKVNDTLVGRRKREADLFRAGAREGVQPGDPRNESEGMLEPADPGDRAPALGAGEPSRAALRYAQMAPEARAHLMTRARNALSDTLAAQGKDALDKVNRTGQLPVDDEGKSILDYAQRVMSPNKLARLTRQINEAKTGFELRSPLVDMTEEQAEKFLSSPSYGRDESGKLVPREGGDVIPPGQLKDSIWKDWQKIKDGRQADPVEYISGTVVKGVKVSSYTRDENGELVPHYTDDGEFKTKPAQAIRAATALIETARNEQKTPAGINGKLFTTLRADPIKQREMLIDARLEDQARLGIERPKVISKAEGDALLKIPKGAFKDLDSKTYKDGIVAAADRFYQFYGPKYAKKAFEDAIGFHLTKEDDARTANNEMSKLIAAQAFRAKGFGDGRAGGPATLAEVREARQGLDRIRNLDEIDRVGRIFEGESRRYPMDQEFGGIAPFSYGGSADRKEGGLVAPETSKGGPFSRGGETGRTLIQPALSAADGLSGVANYAEAQARRSAGMPPDKNTPPPNDALIEWVRQNPAERAPVFDDEYGDGAWARVQAEKKKR